MSAINTRDIYKIHFGNKRLIEVYDIKHGNNYKLKKKLIKKYGFDYVTIESIDLQYGWVLCKETRKLPHKVLSLLNCFIFEHKYVAPKTFYRVVFAGKDQQSNTAGEIFSAFGKKAILNPLTKNIHYTGNKYNFIAYPEDDNNII